MFSVKDFTTLSRIIDFHFARKWMETISCLSKIKCALHSYCLFTLVQIILPRFNDWKIQYIHKRTLAVLIGQKCQGLERENQNGKKLQWGEHEPNRNCYALPGKGQLLY